MTNLQCQALRRSEPSGTDSSASVDVLLGNLSLRASLRSDLLAADNALCPMDCPNVKCSTQYSAVDNPPNFHREIFDTDKRQLYGERPEFDISHANAQGDNTNVVCCLTTSSETDQCLGDGDCKYTASSRLSLDYEQEFGKENIVDKHVRLPDWDPRSIERPIENEEWVAFLQRSMEEVMDQEFGSLLQQNCVSVFVSPLRNPAASCRVVEYVACLLSLPFVQTVSAEDLEQIQQVYLDVRVVPNLVYAVKLLMTERSDGESSPSQMPKSRCASTLSADELQALECTILLLCRLVYVQEKFLTQFCDAVYIVNGMTMFQQLLTLEKRKARVVADLIAIMNNVLRSQPENAELVERVVLRNKSTGEWLFFISNSGKISFSIDGLPFFLRS